MGQEGPCQPHPNHEEEADKDKARLHSWRGSEKKEAEDRPWRKGGRYAVMSIPRGSRKGNGSRERELEKGHGFCKREHLRMLVGFGGSAREGSYTSLGSEKDLKRPRRGVIGREFTLFHHFVQGPW